MVIDTSAVTAILRGEADRESLLAALLKAPRRVMSAVTALEAAMVIQGRYGPEAGADLELFLFNANIEIVPFDAEQLAFAQSGWKRFGKGNHPAGLNLGDCCSYALAKYLNEPLLCKGDDFPQTGIAIASL